MNDHILYEDSSVFFQVSNALPPFDPCEGLDDVPVMFRRGAVARRLAVARYIGDTNAERALDDYIDGSCVGQQRSRIEVLAGHIFDDLTTANSPDALQSWYVEVYDDSSDDDELVFVGRRPYPKDMNEDAIRTWLQREFNPNHKPHWSYTVMTPQPHPFNPQSL